MNTGLRQGDVPSPLLFNLVLKKVIRIWHVMKWENTILAYTDDIVVIDNTHA